MKKGSESVAQLDEMVTVTALGGEEAIFKARFIDQSSEGMQIKLNSGLEVGSLLKLEFRDDLMMTEVSRCEPDEGGFSAGLSIISCLQKSELERLRREAVAGPGSEA